MVPTGWTLPPYPWIAGLRPYPYPYIPTGWRPLNSGTDLSQALQQLGAYACAQSADPTLARQYADLVNLLGYLQGDVADAIEQPAGDSQQRRLAARARASGRDPRRRRHAAARRCAVVQNQATFSGLGHPHPAWGKGILGRSARSAEYFRAPPPNPRPDWALVAGPISAAP